MRNIYLLFLGVFPFLSNAQIVVDDSDMPSSNNEYYTLNVSDYSIVDLAITGVNVTWDYSSLVGTSEDTLIAESVSSTPAAYQFYFNNAFLYSSHYANYAVAAQGIDLAGQVTISDRFDYYKNDNQGHKIVGFGAKVNSIPTSVRYNNIDFVYDFPMNFDDSIISFADFEITIPSMGTYGSDINRTKDVDGWGTIITPFGTFDCLRVKTTLDITDTVYVAQGPFPFGTTITRPTEIIYDWITKSEGIPVLTVTERGGVITAAKFKTAAPNSINENEISFGLYPNPASASFKIDSELNGELFVADLTGKLVLTSTSKTIDVSQLKTGFYSVLFKAENGSVGVEKLEVIK